jgi:hypothetical protein
MACLCYKQPMPSYTILFMRRDATDRRPFTIHIGAKLFWFLGILAVGLPVAGFLVSYGFIAPKWLEFNFKSMERQVAEAEKTEQKNENLETYKEKLETTLQAERTARAEADARITMAETARIEASNRLVQLEGELITLKQSLATYEKLFKPKLSKELLECVGTSASLNNNVVDYSTTFVKIGKGSLPNGLTARVRVLVGDNALTMAGDAGGGVQTTHPLNLNKSSEIKGKFTIQGAADGARVLDIKMFDAGNTQVGYCWKAF